MKSTFSDDDPIYNPISKHSKNVWLLTEKLIIELRDRVVSNGGRFVLFVQDSIPTQLSRKTDRYYVEDRLGRFCVQNAMHCTFMGREAVNQFERTKINIHGFSSENAGHWNEEGHKMAYMLLEKILKNMSVIK